MGNTNRFLGLARGPINHKSGFVINLVSNGAIDMGSAVALSTTIFPREIFPRVEEISIEGSSLLYGIAVGGEVDGIYGDGSASVDDSTRATNGAGQRVVVVTQGRCLARVSGPIVGGIGNGVITQSTTLGVLRQATSDNMIFGTTLNDVGAGDTDMIAVDFFRFGPD